MRSERGVGHLLVIVVIVAAAIVGVLAFAEREHQSSTPVRPALDTSTVSAATHGTVVALEATLPSGGRATGTGIVLTSGGEVVASYHSVEDASQVRVHTSDGRVFSAHVVGYSVNDDVALLQVDGAPPLRAVALGDASMLTVRTPIAVSSSNGVTAGSIESLHRDVTAGDANDPDGIETLHDMMQIDVPSRPGDTGAPVVDAQGRVVALVTAATHGRRFHEQGDGFNSFATPMPDVVAIVDQIDAGENNATVHSGQAVSLGVTLDAVPGGGSGALVSAVPPNTKDLAPGDVVVELDGATITTPADLATALNIHKPGDVVQLGWVDPKGVYHSAKLALH